MLSLWLIAYYLEQLLPPIVYSAPDTLFQLRNSADGKIGSLWTLVTLTKVHQKWIPVVGAHVVPSYTITLLGVNFSCMVGIVQILAGPDCHARPTRSAHSTILQEAES